jgi:Zn-dependent peptidase ImmA (M78 family)
MTKEEIVTSTTTLLEKYGIDKPVVNVFQIAEDEGVKLNFVKMPEILKNVAGFFDFEDKEIYVNDDDPPNRQTFTVAHELGHFLLNHDKNEYGVLYRMQKINGENSPLEKEANLFAANLLVPSKMLKDTIKKYNLNDKDDEILASLFGVSKEMMGYRLKTCLK